MIFYLIAIGCLVAILFINAHEKDKAARRQYNAQLLANAVQAGKDQERILQDVDELQDMIAQARTKILKAKKQ